MKQRKSLKFKIFKPQISNVKITERNTKRAEMVNSTEQNDHNYY